MKRLEKGGWLQPRETVFANLLHPAECIVFFSPEEGKQLIFCRRWHRCTWCQAVACFGGDCFSGDWGAMGARRSRAWVTQQNKGAAGGRRQIFPLFSLFWKIQSVSSYMEGMSFMVVTSFPVHHFELCPMLQNLYVFHWMLIQVLIKVWSLWSTDPWSSDPRFSLRFWEFCSNAAVLNSERNNSRTACSDGKLRKCCLRFLSSNAPLFPRYVSHSEKLIVESLLICTMVGHLR